MSIIAMPMPLPGYGSMYRNASKIAKPATSMATIQAHGCNDHRPNAAASHRTPPRIASQPQMPGGFEGREVAQHAEPVEAEQAQAEEQPAEAGQGGKEADDGYEDGRVLHGYNSLSVAAQRRMGLTWASLAVTPWWCPS